MPVDFWRNDHMLKLFRTKPCQRLARDGVCQWKSRCQFSHNTEWPRRPPRKHGYSPRICPNIKFVEAKQGVATGPAVQIRNLCTSGLSCPFAHSVEEVLFHPQMFKTFLCDEHSIFANQKHRGSKKGKCHRYYCPFAHGPSELRTSTLTQEQRDDCMKMLDLFPSDECCKVCSQHRVVTASSSNAEGSKTNQASSSEGNTPSYLRKDVPKGPVPVQASSPSPAAYFMPPCRTVFHEPQFQASQRLSLHGDAPANGKDPFLMPPLSLNDPFVMPPCRPCKKGGSISTSQSTSLDSSPYMTPLGSSTSSEVEAQDTWTEMDDMPFFITRAADGTATIGPNRPTGRWEYSV